MPTNHILALGPSAGVVTAPLAYVRHKLANWQPSSSEPGESEESFFDLNDRWHNQDATYVSNANTIDKVVVLTSQQIIEGSVKGKCRWNEYGEAGGEDHVDVNALEEVRKFLRQEFGCSGRKPALYVVRVEINNIQSVLHRMLEVLGWLVPLGERGDNTWVNVTGLTNVVDEGMLIATYLMGTVGRIYYTFVDRNILHIKPVDPTDGPGLRFWNDLPLLRIDLSDGLLLFLDELDKYPDGIDGEELLKRLHQRDEHLFKYDYSSTDNARICIAQFSRMYLNKLSSYVQRIDEHTNAISQAGKKLLSFLSDPAISSITDFNRNPVIPRSLGRYMPTERNRPSAVIPLEYCGRTSLVDQVAAYDAAHPNT